MAWIKRNLYFIIGGTLAVALMGLAGWYLYSKWALNNSKLEALKTQYDELSSLAKQNPNPGEEGKMDNVAAAKEQQGQLHDFNGKVVTYYQRITRIPDVPKVGDQEFSKALSLNIDQLQRAASNASVTLPAEYCFSFQAERNLMSFNPAGLPALATQLGEVKAILDVLFGAKVNSLDGLRRERSSPDDAGGPESDYIDQRSLTNSLAVVSPYELTFRCFSPELASILAGFASSPYGMVVKSINVEHAPAVAEEVAAPMTPAPVVYAPPSVPVRRPDDRYAERYRSPSPGGDPNYRRYAIPPPVAPVPVAPGAPAAKGGLQIVLDEKQLRVRLVLNIVKLLPAKPK